MNKKTINKVERYQSPLCHQVDVVQEGLLCASGVIEVEDDYNSTLDNFNQNTESYW